MALQEKQLGQLRPANTTAASLYSPGASTTTIAYTLVVCNTSAASAKYRIFHDDDGTPYYETTALFWDIPIATDTTDTIEIKISANDANGNIAVRTDTNSALTFTLYGAEIT